MAETINLLACVLLLYCLVGSSLAGWTTLAPEVLPEEALAWRLRAIDSATVPIDMETFLWKPDRSGLQIPAAMFQFRWQAAQLFFARKVSESILPREA